MGEALFDHVRMADGELLDRTVDDVGLRGVDDSREVADALLGWSVDLDG